MIVKFFKRGSVKDIHYSTGGESAKRYLLGKDYADGVASRDHAKLLAGDPNEVTEIINALTFSKIYTSGCLAFDGIESQYVTESMKRELMDEFEQCLFVGLDKPQYAGYWVEHFDKVDEKNNNLPRLELNFVFANVELTTGKALPVYYHLIDEKRVDTFKEIKNLEMQLSDPNALERKRLIRIGDKLPQNVKDTVADIDDKLTNAFMNELVNSRDDVIHYLSEHYEITAIKNQSISIKNPHGGSRPIRLQGAFYEKTFESRGTLGEEFDQTRNHRRHRESPDSERIVRLKADYQEYCDKRSAELAKRFKPRATKQSELGRGKDNRVTANPCFTYRPVIKLPAPFRDFNSYFNDFRRTATSITGIERENRSEVTTANRTDRGSIIDANRDSTGKLTPAGESKSDTLRVTDGQSRRAVSKLDDNSGPAPTKDRTSISYREQTANQLFGNTVLPADIIHEREPHRVDEVEYLGQFYDSDDSYYPLYLGGMGGIFGVSEHSKSGGLIHATESSQSATANHTGQAVTRVAQQAGHSFGANETSTANPNQRYAITVNTNVVDQAYAHYRAGSSKAESANAEQGGDLLERITDYQSTAVENAKIRQGRVSALTNQDKISFEPIRIHTNGRRQRRRKVIHDLADIDNQLTETGEQLGDLATGYDQQTNRFVSINRRVRKVKNGYDHDAQQFKTATNNFGAVVGTVSAIVNAVIELFKKLFNGLKQQVVGYAKEGVLYGVSGDGKQHQMSQQEAESYMRSHPYDLSGYAQLTLTVKKLEKDKELKNEPFRGFGM